MLVGVVAGGAVALAGWTGIGVVIVAAGVLNFVAHRLCVWIERRSE
jgi:hypothetical protein